MEELIEFEEYADVVKSINLLEPMTEFEMIVIDLKDRLSTLMEDIPKDKTGIKCIDRMPGYKSKVYNKPAVKYYPNGLLELGNGSTTVLSGYNGDVVIPDTEDDKTDKSDEISNLGWLSAVSYGAAQIARVHIGTRVVIPKNRRIPVDDHLGFVSKMEELREGGDVDADVLTHMEEHMPISNEIDIHRAIYSIASHYIVCAEYFKAYDHEYNNSINQYVTKEYKVALPDIVEHINGYNRAETIDEPGRAREVENLLCPRSYRKKARTLYDIRVGSLVSKRLFSRNMVYCNNHNWLDGLVPYTCKAVVRWPNKEESKYLAEITSPSRCRYSFDIRNIRYNEVSSLAGEAEKILRGVTNEVVLPCRTDYTTMEEWLMAIREEMETVTDEAARYVFSKLGFLPKQSRKVRTT